MKIPKEDQIKGIMCEDCIGWFAKWFKDKSNYQNKPSTYIDITADDVMSYVSEHGFDSATVSYEPLEARYLIEQINEKWCVSFYEHGYRQGMKEFETKEDAERFVAAELIETNKMWVDVQFG